MTDIILQGICGRMGHALIEKISQREDCRVVAGIDQQAGKVGDIPVYASLDDLPVRGVVIDFSSPAGSVSAAKYCAEHGMPCVICSTGLSKEDEGGAGGGLGPCAGVPQRQHVGGHQCADRAGPPRHPPV